MHTLGPPRAPAAPCGLGASLLGSLLLGGCAGPSYLLYRPEPGVTAPAPAGTVHALRERDSQQVLLRQGTFRARPSDQADVPSGMVRVRGPGRAHPLWRSGAVVTGVGIVLSLLGTGLAMGGIFTNYDRELGRNTCNATERPCPGNPLGLMVGGAVIASVGDVLGLGVGPALWLRGATRRPEELPLP